MKILVFLFLALGYITCAKIRGRGLWADESIWIVIVGHLILVALIALWLKSARQSGKFFTMNTLGYGLMTFGAYLAGYLASLFSSPT